MDEVYSWALAVLVILAFFIPKILGFFYFIVLIGSAILTVIQMAAFTGFQGEFRRGIKVGYAELSNIQVHHLRNLSGNIIERKGGQIGDDIEGYILKKGDEVLVHAREWYGFRWRRAWPVIGYVDLASPKPSLEFRSPLPLVVFLVCLGASIILLPVVAGLWFVSFNMEKQTIEKFISDKVASSISSKESENL